jgi:formylaminopyrimidine deformylase / aminopyrimidine aminohydrolase
VNVADLPKRHTEAWHRATRHEFLDAVRDGSIPEPAFDRWLAQDYAFVGHLLRFQARLLARAPRPAQLVLVQGAAALVDELTWFEGQAQARGLDLGVPELAGTTGYRDLLERLDAADAAVALGLLWAIERVYLEAWSHAAPGAPAFRPYVEHWTTAGFAAYVDDLERAADAALRHAPARSQVEPYFREVVAAEVAFWDMAWR